MLPIPSRLRALVALVSITATACSGDDDDADDNGTRTDAGSCVCTNPTAAEVTYDPTASELNGPNVQDALDELAARPEPGPDVTARIQPALESNEFTSNAPIVQIQVDCPGEQPTKGLALGGSCEGGDVNISIHSTQLGPDYFTCSWLRADEAPVTLTARVTCLMPE